jgi:hypothetical protein
MSPEVCTWSLLLSNVIYKPASLRAFDLTNRVNMTFTPVRSALDLGCTDQLDESPFRRRPGRAGAPLGS